MLELDRIESSLFEPLLGQNFQLLTEATTLELDLVEVTANERLRRENRRAPFALLFRAASGECIPQRIYRIEHTQLGAMEIFIVPVRRDESGCYYEAIFN